MVKLNRVIVMKQDGFHTREPSFYPAYAGTPAFSDTRGQSRFRTAPRLRSTGIGSLAPAGRFRTPLIFCRVAPFEVLTVFLPSASHSILPTGYLTGKRHKTASAIQARVPDRTGPIATWKEMEDDAQAQISIGHRRNSGIGVATTKLFIAEDARSRSRIAMIRVRACEGRAW